MRLERVAQRRLAGRVRDRHDVDPELRRLRGERRDVGAPGRQRPHGEAVAVAAYDVQRLGPDGPGAPEDDDAAHASSVTDARPSGLRRARDPAPSASRAVGEDGRVPSVTRVAADDPDVGRFSAALLREMAERYGGDPDEIAGTAPGAEWVLLRDDDGTPLGCGALQPLRKSIPGAAADHGEVKRVYVDPAARGRGLSRPLMDALLVLAAELGYTWLQLETGTEQPEAVGLYERSGWRRVANYGQYVDDPRSVCFGLPVPADRPAVDG